MGTSCSIQISNCHVGRDYQKLGSAVSRGRATRPDGAETEEVKTGATWMEMLADAAESDLWNAQPRHERAAWRNYIRAAIAATRSPRRPLPPEDVKRVLEGDLCNVTTIQLPSSKVELFLSSTFTDTQAERNQLMKDVFPFLRRLCHQMNLEFGTVDMRWGVKESTTREHGTTDICLQQIVRCCERSCGPAFLAILGNKYGYRPLPARIDKSEFGTLVDVLRECRESVDDLQGHYLLDQNNQPPLYVLKPRDPSVSNDEWWGISIELQRKLQLAARHLPAEQRGKYYVSVTEQEVFQGCLDNSSRQIQALVVLRHLEDIDHKHHLNRRLVDIRDGHLDDDAQQLLEELKYDKVTTTMSGDTVGESCDGALFSRIYKDKGIDCRREVRDTCDIICKALSERILRYYEVTCHIERDPVYEEVIRHAQFVVTRSEGFRGHEGLVDRLVKIIGVSRGQPKPLLVLHGVSGSGKTSLMAVLAQRLRASVMADACVVVRFAYTTTKSGSLQHLLTCVCHQMAHVYRDTGPIPLDTEELVVYFRRCLAMATADKPLVVILDAIDQLLYGHFRYIQSWCCEEGLLPPHSHVIISISPGECVDILRGQLPKGALHELPFLPHEHGMLALESLLAAKGRTITAEQKTILEQAYEWNPFPLYVKMLADMALHWHSYDIITQDQVAGGVSGMTSLLLERLEDRYGQVFVSHALAYVTASKDGLSGHELEDIVSCDDDALDELFDFWLPPQRRLPPLMLARLLNDLQEFLVEKGTDDGISVYVWYHKQLRQAADERYLGRADSDFRSAVHQALGDYFCGRWSEGKVWTPKKLSRTVTDLEPRLEDRMVAPQPLVFVGNRGDVHRKLNKRKLREMTYHLIKAGDMAALEQELSLEFIEAKFEAGQGYDCRADLKMATKQGTTPLVRALSKVVDSAHENLLHDPSAIYQLVWQQVSSSPTRALLEAVDRSSLRATFITEVGGAQVDDPCILTLRGHVAPVCQCQLSPDGLSLASTSKDGTLRIWDTQTGADQVTVTVTPFPVSSTTKTASGTSPCVWDRKGQVVMTGEKTGQVRAWKKTGTEVEFPASSKEVMHQKAVTGLSVSPDNSLLVSCSKDSTFCVWNLPELSHVTTVSLDPGELGGCEFSPDGDQLALVWRGTTDQQNRSCSILKVYSTSKWSMISSREGEGNQKFFCLTYSPRGQLIATGSDRNVVELWENQKEEAVVLPKAHHAYVRCVQFTEKGARLLSCGDDFMLMVWDIDKRSHLATLAGHVQQVTWVCASSGSVGPVVTASADTTLKAWDYEAIREGRVPEADGIPFVDVQLSHDRKYVMTVQGVNSFARIYDTSLDQFGRCMARSPRMPYSLAATRWMPGDTGLLTMDAGHSGNDAVDAYRRATVRVCPFPSTEGDTNGPDINLEVQYPACIAINDNYIGVGTCSKTVVMFHVDSLEVSRTLPWDPAVSDQHGQEHRITAIDLHPKKNQVAAATGHEIKVWSISLFTRPKVKVTLASPRNQQISECRFCPSGRYLIYASLDALVLVKASRGNYRQVHVLSGHVGQVLSLAVCPMSQHLAAACLDGTLRVWKLSPRCPLVAAYYNSSARRLAFLSSKELLVGGGTGPLRRLRLEDAATCEVVLPCAENDETSPA